MAARPVPSAGVASLLPESLLSDAADVSALAHL
jgi:hypothetical protein